VAGISRPMAMLMANSLVGSEGFFSWRGCDTL
jgi:hypothetical protein